MQEYTKLKKWMRSKPYQHKTTLRFVLDREGCMLMALCLGMLIRDLHLAQFGLNDPDDEGAAAVPHFVGESTIPFEAIDTVILPVCTEMTEAIHAPPPVPRTSDRKPVPPKSKEVQASALPEVEGQNGKREHAGTSESSKGAEGKKRKRK